MAYSMVRHPFQFPVYLLSWNLSLLIISQLMMHHFMQHLWLLFLGLTQFSADSLQCCFTEQCSCRKAVQCCCWTDSDIQTMQNAKLTDSDIIIFEQIMFFWRNRWRWGCKSVTLTLNSVNCHLWLTLLWKHDAWQNDNDCKLVLVLLLYLCRLTRNKISTVAKTCCLINGSYGSNRMLEKLMKSLTTFS